LSIADRQKSAALGALKGTAARVEIETRSVPSPGPGTFLFLKAEGGPCGAGFSSIGIRGKRAEMVGAEAAGALLAYLHKDGCLDPHLSDQIVLYLAIAAGRSVFTTTQITSHLVTNIEVITRFLDAEYDIEGEIGSPGKVSVTGVGYHQKGG
jgi:RNA 3'-terminal phosphate cyclase (ATP)